MDEILTKCSFEHLQLEVSSTKCQPGINVFIISINRIFLYRLCKFNLLSPLAKQTKLNVSDEILSKCSFVQNISGWRSLPPNVNQASMFFTSIFTGDQRIQKNSFENADLFYLTNMLYVCFSLNIVFFLNKLRFEV